jgi:hypothetical protein
LHPPVHDAFDEDEIALVFPDCDLTHVLTIISSDQLSVGIEALTAVRAIGGRLEALNLSRRAAAFEHQLKVVGLRPRQARLLADRLAALPGVAHASVEHWLARV